jgi:signal transduction histidine kinase
MRERVETMDGSLQVETAPGQGARIIISYKKL